MSCWRGIVAIAVLALTLARPATLAAQQLLEYEVKAVFLFNFTRFVDWPPEAFPDSTMPLTICIVEPDPFGPALDEAFASETYQGRPYAIRRVAPADDLAGCHLIFISRAVPPASVLSGSVNETTLTVGESPDFIEAGGMISFYLEQNRVRFEIHQAAVERSAVRIGSQLMRLARLLPS